MSNAVVIQVAAGIVFDNEGRVLIAERLTQRTRSAGLRYVQTVGRYEMSLLLSLFLLGGAIAITASWLWVIVIAFNRKDTGWGVISILISPAALLYGAMNWQHCRNPITLFIAGLAMLIVPYVLMTVVIR